MALPLLPILTTVAGNGICLLATGTTQLVFSPVSRRPQMISTIAPVRPLVTYGHRLQISKIDAFTAEYINHTLRRTNEE